MRLYAFDGTGNHDSDDDDRDTNVVRFCKAFTGVERVDTLYVKGVGTKLGPIGRVIGGITGAGGWGRVIEARTHLEQHWQGEPIVVVGFSRGSALALDFCNEIAGGVTGKRMTAPRVPVIRFLGLWDLVASFGIPGNNINLGYQLTVPDAVEHCCHAMALDERRYTFAITRVKYALDKKRENGEKKAYEVWFRGGHGDIGGGNRNVARGSIALRWMMLHALSHGVPLDASAMPAPAVSTDTLPVQAKQWFLKWARKPAVNERVHESVEWSLNAGYLDPPAPYQVEADPAVV